MGITDECYSAKYLVLPTAVGNNKSDKFSTIIERVQKRLMGWKEKNLSYGGKEVMIKAVVQAILTYTMQCFKLPRKMCSQLSLCANRFWWGSSEDKRKIHWKSWQDMVVSKFRGGLGFRDFELFNQALLAKQGWRLIENPNSLCARVLKARYYPSYDFLEAKLGYHPSYTWRSIIHSREALKEGVVWRVGNDRSINIWRDSWVPDSDRPPTMLSTAEAVVSKVADLIEHQSRTWRRDVLERCFNPEEARKISLIQLADHELEDHMAWKWEESGIFTIRSMYRALSNKNRASEIDQTDNIDTVTDMRLWRIIWGIKVQSKVSNLLWRIAHDIIPTTKNLQGRSMDLSSSCFRCNNNEETTVHAVWKCEASQQVWRAISERFNISFADALDGSAKNWLANNLVGKSDNFHIIFAMTMWMIWHNRNLGCHEGRCKGTPELFESIQRHVQEAFSTASTFHMGASESENRAIPSRRPNNRCLPGEGQWSRPPFSWHKLNTDGAINKVEGIAGIGVVIHDCNGSEVGGLTKVFQGVINALVCEALAVKEGLKKARKLGATHIVVETDSLQLVKLVNSEENISNIRSVIHDIKTLRSCFVDSVISHARRENNNVAHSGAKLAVLNGLDLEWDAIVPNQVVLFRNLHVDRRDE